ncbi:glycosyltransferase [Gilvibacter sp.]|uniref:glycosyltransferase n=1 Tax=Gilvibacter sp. TaxID=2729997 RepID=UPI0035BE9FB5
MLLLSGPEPQRSLLEEILLEAFKDSDKRVLCVLGKPESSQERYTQGAVEVVTYMTSEELETAINASDVIISRSGYTTIMDLAALEKKALFIPTPGQYEQEYLAKKLSAQGLVPYVTQDRFTLDALGKVPLYSGLRMSHDQIRFSDLFAHF